MKLDSVRSLKMEIREKLERNPATVAAIQSLGAATGPIKGALKPKELCSFGLGVAPTRNKWRFKLAVRVQRRSLEGSRELDRIRRASKGEVDIRYVGEIIKRSPWYQERQRPLLIGSSIGHFRVTAGTLGCFVRSKDDPNGKLMILSNNHVLADENRGREGDSILQPGNYDKGRRARDTVGTLEKFVTLRKTTNQVDAAVAVLKKNMTIKDGILKGVVGNLKGLGPDFLDEGMKVVKIGRTTGVRKGRVSAFELDDVWVKFDPHLGAIPFNGQVEIEGQDSRGFSDGGDSGSLIFSEEEREAVALLFAGSDQGGGNGQGLTYANPIRVVFKKLAVELVL